ncbi:MAG: ABC transporter ATP-binding protein [Thermoleophilia bacterium]|nr:ABC transporter ATP-binding protein [Thermoleophilia bacterium]
MSLRGVAKRYGSERALEPTDLDVRDGEFFCLLGPSGCGKTTTLNLIGGFVEPTQGEIWIRGERVDRVPPHLRSVNTVFQSYALFPHMTVRDNVGFGLRMARVPKPAAAERVARALQRVGLEGFEERYPGQLSGGQQQRVAVARALVNEPAVLLLDEPLGALDLKLRKRLQIELAQIQRSVGTTFVYVTHDQEEAMTMADRIAVMNDGRIEQIGTPVEVYDRPRSSFVADFIGESNFVPVVVDESGSVRLENGRSVPGSAGADTSPGAATLMVRPESIHVTDGDGPADALHGRVERTAYLGTFTRVIVQCDGVPAPMIAALYGKQRAQAIGLEPNAGVGLHWDAEDAIVLRERTTEREEE